MEEPAVAGKSGDTPELSQLTALVEVTAEKHPSSKPVINSSSSSKALPTESSKTVKPKPNIFTKLSLPSLTKGSRPKVKITPRRKDLNKSFLHEEERVMVPPEPKENVEPGSVLTNNEKDKSSPSTGPPVSKENGKTGNSTNAQEKPKKDAPTKPSPKESSPKSPLKMTSKQENGYQDLKLKPFDFGWKREVVYRAVTDVSEKKKKPADIYYFTPANQKLRSMPEIITFLREHPSSDLGPENFTFLKEPIYRSPQETVRQAKPRPKGDGAPSAPKSPKPKAPTVSEDGTLLTPKMGGATGSPLGSPDLLRLGKRARKIKDLPVGFVCPNESNLFRKRPVPAPVPKIVAASLQHGTGNVNSINLSGGSSATNSILNTQKLLPNVIKRSHKRKLPSSDVGAPPLKQPRIIPLLVEVKREMLSGSEDNETGSSDTMLSPLRATEISSRPKVMFTFSKLSNVVAIEDTDISNRKTMSNGQSCGQVIPFKKRRITNAEPIKVSQNDRMCSLSCPGRSCQLPTLHCTICLCLFHPECVGFLHGPPTEEFKCQRCLYQPYLKSSETSKKPSKPEANLTETDDPEILAEENELNNIASSDDDEMFMTVAPEIVMAPSSIPTPEQSTSIPSTVYQVRMPSNVNNQNGEINSGSTATGMPSVLPLMPSTTVTYRVKSVVPMAEKPQPSVTDTCTDNQTQEKSNTTSTTSQTHANTCQPRTVPITPNICATVPVSTKSSVLENPPSFVSSIMNPGSFISGSMLGNFPVISSSTVPTPGVPIMTGIPGIVLGTPQFRLPLPIDSGAATATKPSIPVSMLPNAAPIVVGSQILTPVSINLSGIAKGTLIYTNNPTLRFLLPSTGGLASFGVQPGITSPPKVSVANVAPTTTVSSSAESTPQTSVQAPSQFLPITPPVQVINVRGASLCDIMLKLPVKDGHLFSTKVKLTNKDLPGEMGPPKDVPTASLQTSPSTGSEADSSKTLDDKTTPESEGKEDESREMLDDMELSDKPLVIAEATDSAPANNDDLPNVADKTTTGSESSEVLSSALKEESTEETKSTDNSRISEITVNDAKAADCIEADLELSNSSDDNGVSEPCDKDSEESVPIPVVEEPSPVDEFAHLSGPVLSPRHPVFEDSEIFSPIDVLSDIAVLSESDDDEIDSYRPMTPVVLKRVTFDGNERIVTRRLSNKGAKLTSKECARISEFTPSIREFGRNEEHGYHLSDYTEPHIRRSITTLKIERRPYHMLHTASESLNLVFEYLSIPDLLRAGQVCKTWRKLANQQYLWSTVKLKGIQIIDWKMCVTTLDLNNTALLDLRGVVQDSSMWHNFLATAHHLRKVQGVVFGEVPTWVITSVVNCLPELRCLEAEDIVNESKTLVKMDPGVLSRLQEINILRIRGPNGMEMPKFEIYGGLKMLGTLSNLTHLSLTSMRKLSNDDVRFLEKLTHLQVLEIGQCREWTEQAYHSLGKLRAVRRLRLEMGNQMADRGLANALIQMPRLQELTLLAYRITTSMAASIRRLKHLWHLTIWPDMSTEGAMVVYNTLQAVRSLKRLQSFSWGIIYQDDDKTRYSKKQGKGKYKEASDVDEWWSEELRKTQRAKGIKIPMLKAFSESSGEQPSKEEETKTVPGMEQGLIGVGHLRHKLQKLLPDSEIYVYQVPESLLNGVYGTSR